MHMPFWGKWIIGSRAAFPMRSTRAHYSLVSIGAFGMGGNLECGQDATATPHSNKNKNETVRVAS